MAKTYENEFKSMIVELLQSGRPVKEVSKEYALNDSMISAGGENMNQDQETFQSLLFYRLISWS